MIQHGATFLDNSLISLCYEDNSNYCLSDN